MKTCPPSARRPLCHTLLCALLVWLSLVATPAMALEPGVAEALGDNNFSRRSQAVADIIAATAQGDAEARELLVALSANKVPNARLNNQLRSRISAAAAVLALESPNRAERARAVDALLASPPPPTMIPLVDALVAKEQDSALQERMALLSALIALDADDPALRAQAAERIGATADPRYRPRLLPLAAPDVDPVVRSAAQDALARLDAAERTARQVGTLFAGISLGSVLLLAALGLAITYGLIGVINMAHGEFLMIGAYATFVVQNLFRQYLPGAFDWYLLAAVPVAFVTAALVGVVLERLVIRHLYGRPLETLLTTFGISLLLMQSVRMLFGAQNVEVMNPSWMSGGISVMPGLLLPWNRIVIIGFAIAVVLCAWLVLTRTRLGLFIRAVTQNRTMAACAGVPTNRVDTQAFAFGAGIAGLGGCALAQIGNVGPDLGQTYIIDSFMVVVLGGVGQLAGAVVGAFGLGIVSKIVEPFWGAVLAKIAVLLLIILFIQKRPQGLFALKGRSVEA
ncbi:urea ABC transporter permease subunit UrtB [Verticiella sediminum]|uniref:Urea ABC transporter permease subunit UrtB n=1 Tax=Verticiella sediminum TaxID=1247510 RepID=A0A556ABJ3_9BURK|nr:urea ABC transporter permease subunit UrtB [Verticiella sediminum]TSH90240.1 urea ABC transporter permease subunit UrtB [Verticiella sediminum]